MIFIFKISEEKPKTTIVFRLHNGKKVEAQFNIDTRVSELFTYVMKSII